MNKVKNKLDFNGLTLDELNSVQRNVKRLIHVKECELIEERKNKALTELNVGATVMVSGKQFEGEKWKVVKLNPKKVKCKRENGEDWNIPYSNIIMDFEK